MNGRDIPRSNAAEWIKFVSATLIFPLAGFTFIWLLSIDRRVTRIEANRFTSADGATLMEKLNNKADLSNVPPPEVIIRLNRIESDINDLRADVRALLERR